MAIQRLDLTPTPHPIGEALGTGLEALAAHKMQQLQRHTMQAQTARGLQALGFSPQQAGAYAQLDPNLLQLVVKQHLEQPSQQAFAQGLQAILGGGGQPTVDTMSTVDNRMESTAQPSPRIPTEGELLGQKIFGNLERIDQVPSTTSTRLPQAAPKLPGQPSTQPRIKIPAGLKPQQALQLAQLGLQKQAVTQKEEAAQRKFDKQLAAKEQQQAQKETLPYYNKVLEEDKAAKKIDMDTDRMIKLIEKGKLPNPVWYKTLKDIEDIPAHYKLGGIGAGAIAGYKFGGVPGAVAGAGLATFLEGVAGAARWLQKTPDIEEFEKLSANFISGAKAVFGSGRLTDQDLKAFLLTVPQLSNSDAGKKAIIRNIKLMNEASHVRAKAMKSIIEANNGRRPANLEILVERIVEPELDRIAQEFTQETRKEVTANRTPGITDDDVLAAYLRSE